MESGTLFCSFSKFSNFGYCNPGLMQSYYSIWLRRTLFCSICRCCRNDFLYVGLGIRIFRLKHGLSRQTYNIRLGWKRNRMKNHKSQFGVESGPFLPNIEGSGLCFQPTLEYNYEWCSQGFNLRLRNEFFLLIQKSGTFNLIFRIAHFPVGKGCYFDWVLLPIIHLFRSID